MAEGYTFSEEEKKGILDRFIYEYVADVDGSPVKENAPEPARDKVADRLENIYGFSHEESTQMAEEFLNKVNDLDSQILARKAEGDSSKEYKDIVEEVLAENGYVYVPEYVATNEDQPQAENIGAVPAENQMVNEDRVAAAGESAVEFKAEESEEKIETGSGIISDKSVGEKPDAATKEKAINEMINEELKLFIERNDDTVTKEDEKRVCDSLMNDYGMSEFYADTYTKGSFTTEIVRIKMNATSEYGYYKRFDGYKKVLEDRGVEAPQTEQPEQSEEKEEVNQEEKNVEETKIEEPSLSSATEKAQEEKQEEAETEIAPAGETETEIKEEKTQDEETEVIEGELPEQEPEKGEPISVNQIDEETYKKIIAAQAYRGIYGIGEDRKNNIMKSLEQVGYTEEQATDITKEIQSIINEMISWVNENQSQIQSSNWQAFYDKYNISPETVEQFVIEDIKENDVDRVDDLMNEAEGNTQLQEEVDRSDRTTDFSQKQQDAVKKGTVPTNTENNLEEKQNEEERI